MIQRFAVVRALSHYLQQSSLLLSLSTLSKHTRLRAPGCQAANIFAVFSTPLTSLRSTSSSMSLLAERAPRCRLCPRSGPRVAVPCTNDNVAADAHNILCLHLREIGRGHRTMRERRKVGLSSIGPLRLSHFPSSESQTFLSPPIFFPLHAPLLLNSPFDSPLSPLFCGKLPFSLLAPFPSSSSLFVSFPFPFPFLVASNFRLSFIGCGVEADGSVSIYTSGGKEHPTTVLSSMLKSRAPTISQDSIAWTRSTLSNLVNGLNVDPMKVIIDSGSDITLISLKALERLLNPPKIKAGQDIKLVQVTGKSSISGYVTLDLFFHTPDGPVKLTVEAYVVKGMSAPFILGNDFADQYSISVIRDDGEAYLEFGSSERRLKVNSSTSALYEDEDGHAFRVKVRTGLTQHGPKAKVHRRNQKLNRKKRLRYQNCEVWAAKRVVIPPETSVAVPVQAVFPQGQDIIFVERYFGANGNVDDVYASPDTLIHRDSPVLHVANFASLPVVISTGQRLGQYLTVIGSILSTNWWRIGFIRYTKSRRPLKLFLLYLC
ncbi:hypothetical protein DFH06DRAFT_1348161 [Mycena polygramma]|nr:hypothetical protein DFH06DRAFT_1348161 [Mycena polygramma]